MLDEVRYVPGAADARIQQPFNYPKLTVNVDRTRAQDIGLTQQRCGAEPAGRPQRQLPDQPSFYLDPRNGVTYNVAIQAPQYRIDSLAALESLPVTGIRDCIQRQPPIRQLTGAPGLPPPGRCWAIWPPSFRARSWAP